MEESKQIPRAATAQIILMMYLAVCSVLILIILLSSFQRTDLGPLEGEIYLRPPYGEVNAK